MVTDRVVLVSSQSMEKLNKCKSVVVSGMFPVASSHDGNSSDTMLSKS